MKTSTPSFALLSGMLASLLFAFGFHATAQKIDPVGAKSTPISTIETIELANTPCMSCQTPPSSVA